MVRFVLEPFLRLCFQDPLEAGERSGKQKQGVYYHTYSTYIANMDRI